MCQSCCKIPFVIYIYYIIYIYISQIFVIDINGYSSLLGSVYRSTASGQRRHEMKATDLEATTARYEEKCRTTKTGCYQADNK